MMEFAPEGPMAIPLWINGRPYLTMGDSFFDVINPATGQARHRVPMCGADEAAEAVAAARDAQAAWAALGLAGRQECLARLADALEKYAGHFAKLLGAGKRLPGSSGGVRGGGGGCRAARGERRRNWRRRAGR